MAERSMFEKTRREKIDFSEMAWEFELQNENGKKVVISIQYILAFTGGVFLSIFVQSH